MKSPEYSWRTSREQLEDPRGAHSESIQLFCIFEHTYSLIWLYLVGSYMSTSMSLRPKRDLQFSHCVCDASLAAIKKSSYELDVPFCAQSLLVGGCWFKSFWQVYPKLQYLLQIFKTVSFLEWQCSVCTPVQFASDEMIQHSHQYFSKIGVEDSAPRYVLLPIW